MKVLATIYATKDYENFKINDINRTVSQPRVERMVKTLNNEKFVPPIEVKKDRDGKYIIVDGQHRFSALRQLGRSIPFYETYSDYWDSTQGLRIRISGKNWQTWDTVNSFANNNKDPQIQSNYHQLQEILKYTTSELGQVSLVTVIDLASGINKDLDQSIVKAQHDFREGLFKVKDIDDFKEVIHKISILQHHVNGSIRINSAMLRALFTLFSIKDASPEYLAKSINKSRSSFQILEVQTNNKNVVKGLLDFYNAQITLVGQGNLVRISYKEGINGLIIQNRSFINDLYLKSER